MRQAFLWPILFVDIEHFPNWPCCQLISSNPFCLVKCTLECPSFSPILIGVVQIPGMNLSSPASQTGLLQWLHALPLFGPWRSLLPYCPYLILLSTVCHTSLCFAQPVVRKARHLIGWSDSHLCPSHGLNESQVVQQICAHI